MKQLLIVAKETYIRQVKSVSFLLLILSPFFFALVSGLGGFLGESLDKDAPIGLVVEKAVTDSTEIDLPKDYERYSTQDQAKKALSKDDISGYVVLTTVDGSLEATYHGLESMGQSDKQALMEQLAKWQTATNVKSAQLSPTQLQALSKQVIFKEELGDKKAADKKAGQSIAYFVLVILLYILLLTYSTIVAQEVASEKGTKIMEMIFSSIKASQYFYGKMLGMMGVILTQLVIYVLGFGLLFTQSEQLELLKPVQGLLKETLGNFNPVVIAFVVLALLLYVMLSALCGSLVSRAEDAGKAAQPVLYLVMFGFFAGIFLGQGKDTLLSIIASYIPVTSPFIMPLRLINNHASLLEGCLSLALLLVTIVLVMRFIAKNYAGFILQTDDIGIWKTFKRGMSK